MTCHCGRAQWKYDDVTLTCKAGHWYAIGDKPAPLPKPSRVPHWLPGALLGGSAVLTEIVRALS